MDASFEDSVHITERVQIWVSTYFSIQHIQSAALFARSSAAVEEEWLGIGNATQGDEEAAVFRERSRSDALAYVTGAIFAAAAFVEAAANEFVLDLIAMRGHRLSEAGLQLPEQVREAILEKENELTGKKSNPALKRKLVAEEKLQLCLRQAGRPAFDEEGAPYEDVRILRTLRNEFMHYKVEWILDMDTAGQPTAASPLEEALASRRFSQSPFPVSGIYRYLSHGCAAWAVRSADDFVSRFYTNIGIPIHYRHVRDRLATE